MKKISLKTIAHARSGDKGSNANIGIIAFTKAGYSYLEKILSAEILHDFFKPLGVIKTTRYELPNLNALNFVLEGVLGEGGSRSLRIDSQGKVLGQAALEILIDVPEKDLPSMLP